MGHHTHRGLCRFMSDPVADAIESAIEDAVAAPASIAVEGENVTNRSIPDLIAAAKFRAANNAVNSGNPISCRRQKFPGASGLQPPRY